jgi:hypothetical protein
MIYGHSDSVPILLSATLDPIAINAEALKVLA